MSESDEGSSDLSEFDPVQDLFDRYSITVHPLLALKTRKSWRGFHFSANFNSDHQGQHKYMSYHAKPCQYRGPRLVHKVSVCPHAQAVRLSSAKLNLLPWTDFIKLSVQADYDWEYKAISWSYSLQSKWAIKEIVRKESVILEDNLELRPHWKLSADMPEIKSTFGRRTNDETEVNKGYARVTVPKVVANLSLDRPWPVLDRPLRLLGRRGKGDVHESLADRALRADLTRLDALRSEVLRGRSLDEALTDQGSLAPVDALLEERRANRDAGPLSALTSPLQSLRGRSEKEADAPSTRPEADSQQQPPRTDRPGNLLLWGNFFRRRPVRTEPSGPSLAQSDVMLPQHGGQWQQRANQAEPRCSSKSEGLSRHAPGIEPAAEAELSRTEHSTLAPAPSAFSQQRGWLRMPRSQTESESLERPSRRR